MLTHEQSVKEIDTFRVNLRHAIDVLKAVDDDLAALQKGLTPTQAELIEARERAEDRADVFKSARGNLIQIERD
jgi:hypothetical protein